MQLRPPAGGGKAGDDAGHIIAANLGTKDGAYDGRLSTVPPTGETRAQAMIDYADDSHPSA